MHWRIVTPFLTVLFAVGAFAQAPALHEYTVLRTPNKIVIDGKLDEPGWKAAPFTEPFVIYTNAAPPRFPTQAKMLWDNTYVYIAFLMTDRDVWSKKKVWVDDIKDCLCREEVAEVFIDPDGDGKEYLELEINPYGAVMDLKLREEIAKGGVEVIDLGWSYKGIKHAIGINGTLNDSTDVDKNWILELALPFTDFAPVAPKMNFPPKPGDLWRINLYRYDYGRTAEKLVELSAWNMTDRKRGFHAPDRFGKAIFSDKIAGKN
jgi:hypothetical protein